MAEKANILVGSLRRGSFTRKMAQNVISMFSAGYEVQIVETDHLPPYNFDYDDPSGADFPTPESYTLFRETIKASDGILFVTSESDRTVPACLKNTVNVGSKPNTDVTWKKTSADIIGHFVGRISDYSSQKDLRPALSYFGISPTSQSEVSLSNSSTLFDDSGKLIESTRGFVQDYTG